MKFKQIAVLAALLIPSTAAMALMDVSAFGGYTTLAMGDVNATFNNAKNSSANTAVTNVNSGFYVGANADFSIIPFLNIGPRLEYVQAGQGSLNGSIGGISINDTINSDIILYEVGVSTRIPLLVDGLSVRGGLFAGYGMANGQVYINQTGSSPLVGTSYGAGNGIVGEVDLGVDYKIVAGLSIGLDLGYRMANISNMNVTSNSETGGSTFNAVGQPLLTSNGMAGASGDNFDFSGLNLGGSLDYHF